MVKIAGLDSNNEFEAESVKEHIKNLAASAVDVSGLANHVSGAVTHQTVADRLDIDLGVSVNEISEVTSPTDVYFKDVTTADGRTNPDGMGTLLVVASGAENLTWPGGTRVYGSPPVSSEAFASLVRVSGTVHVIWSAVDSTPAQEPDTSQGVTIAYLRDVLLGNITLDPGASVIESNTPPSQRAAWMFTNIRDHPRTELTLVNGSVDYLLAQEGTDFYMNIEYGPNGATKVSAVLPTNGEPPEPGSGWRIVSASPSRIYDYLNKLQETLGGMVGGSAQSDPKYPMELVIPYHEGTMNDDGTFSYTSETPINAFETTLSTDIPLQRSNEDFESYGVKITFKYLSPEDINLRGGWR